MLFKEIPRRQFVEGDDLVALKQWMRTMSKYAPGTTPIRRLLYRMNEWIWSLGDKMDTNDWTNKLQEVQVSLGNPLPDKVEWIACIGSKPNLRGYTCGLWTTAHAISVAAYKAEKNSPFILGSKAVPQLYDLVTETAYAVPVKSMTSFFLTKYCAHRTDALNKAVIDSLRLDKDDNVLEIGYGRGNGLKYCMDRMADGDGAVFGVEKSAYMEDCARHRFALELAETAKIRLDHATDLRNLPYPTAVFNHIFHVDILKKLSEWGLLEESQWDPMRYLSCLEPAGFVDVKIDYKTDKKAGEYQLITSRRPSSDKQLDDPDVALRELEMQIKKEMLIAELLKSRRKLTKEEQSILDEDLPKLDDPDVALRELEMQIKKEMLIAELLKSRRKLTKEEQSILDEDLPARSVHCFPSFTPVPGFSTGSSPLTVKMTINPCHSPTMNNQMQKA
ncbi:unnamed protein product [Nippostrongylus brasiliensis]|uniref:FAD_SOX domain-containing protein n=1 Tax=Nippostrongylus brasiliensis TaxID=27835 RepID=A0A0N4YN04_NIPBR|nr:unnamed protein product [Nippostrongylus brasiliensis]